MAHHRLFVALRPLREARSAMLSLMGGIGGARWQDDGQLHCTVRFLGEIDSCTAEDVAQALQALRHPTIEAATDGFGVFDRSGRIDTLWLGIIPVSAIRALHGKIDRLLAGAGIVPDRRAYHPHVTLARFARSTAPGPDIVARLPSPPPIALRFDAVSLCESLLAADGARYETVARYPLG